MFEEFVSLWKESLNLLVAEMDLLARMILLLVPLILMELVLMLLMLGITYFMLRLCGSFAKQNKNPNRVSVGIFHPYSQAGGGGERVLWCAVEALHKRYPNVDCIIYSGDPVSNHEDVVEHVRDRFNINLSRNVEFVRLISRPLLEAKLYPRFTMLLQAIGSILVGIEALARYKPKVFVDTMGYSFIYPLVKVMAGPDCKIACYIHYPIISEDMLGVVEEREEAHNNAGFIARSNFLSHLKTYYYRGFASAYGWVGRRADVIMVNSSWTKGHINSIWNVTERAKLVFPPCDILKFASLEISPYKSKLLKKIVSIGQFRPEKNHALQLRSFSRLLELIVERGGDVDAIEVQLVLVGGVRGTEDQTRVSELQDLAVSLGIDRQVEWRINLPFSQMTELMEESCVGLHTMWNEHFGISIAEMQAAGLITVANDSGGPKMDIVVPYDGQETGLLASSVESYAESLYKALTMSDDDREKMQTAGRLSAQRFSDANFDEQFYLAMRDILPGPDDHRENPQHNAQNVHGPEVIFCYAIKKKYSRPQIEDIQFGGCEEINVLL